MVNSISKSTKLKLPPIPRWMKLDNAATIYPATASRKLAAMFRFSITLTEDVDLDTLAIALDTVLKRFPSFSYQLRQGLFWCYFNRIDGVPAIQQDVGNPMVRINWEENKLFMFRVRYYQKRIAAEFFHALTDGTGGITFLLSLTAEYIRLKHGCKINYSDKILDPQVPPVPEEYEDSFYRYARSVGAMEHEKAAYHVPGTVEPEHILNIITGKIPAKDLKGVAKKYNCTITMLLASIMVLAIQEIQKDDPSSIRRKKPIKISIPINLRKIYPSVTLRNFASYVNVSIESKLGIYNLEEVITQIKSQMDMMITEKRLNSKITGNVRAAKNLFVRCIPMVIKKHILSIGERIMGDRYCSSTLSNIGNITLPDEMAHYVTELNFLLGRSRGKPGSVSCVSYKDTLYITFTRKIREADTEKHFFRTLVEMGIPVEIESNQWG